MGMENLAKGGGRKGSACREEEVESVLVWWKAMKAHLGVKGEALVLVLGMGRVGLNELVVEEKGWLWGMMQQLVCIVNVWDFK